MAKTEMTELERAADFNEDKGIVKSLLWVKFLITYKSTNLVLREIDNFISQAVERYPELKEEEGY